MNFETFLALLCTNNLPKDRLTLNLPLYGSVNRAFCKLLSILLDRKDCPNEITINISHECVNYEKSKLLIFKQYSLPMKCYRVAKKTSIVSSRLMVGLCTLGFSEFYFNDPMFGLMKSCYVNNTENNIKRLFATIVSAKQKISINFEKILLSIANINIFNALKQGYPDNLSLSLKSMQINDDIAIQIAGIIKPKHFCKQITIDISQNPFSQLGALALTSRINQIPKISLICNQFNENNTLVGPFQNIGQSISQTLKLIEGANTAITINLSKANINNQIATTIFKILAKGRYPENLTLNLSNNQIDDIGFIDILQELTQGIFNKALFVNLQNNEITDDSAIALGNALSKTPAVEFDLSNTKITLQGFNLIREWKHKKKINLLLVCLTLQQINRSPELIKLPQTVLSKIYEYIFESSTQIPTNKLSKKKLSFVNKVEKIDKKIIYRRYAIFSQQLKKDLLNDRDDALAFFKKSF